MSIELFRRTVEAWNDGDVERFIEFAHPETEFRSRVTDVEGQAYSGHDGLRRYFADLAETFTDRHMEIKEIEQRGEWVVATLLVTATGTGSHARLEWEVFQAARTRDGLWIQNVAERTKHEALAAAGIE